MEEMGVMRILKLGAWMLLALGVWSQADARGDDSFRCGTHLVELGDSPSTVEQACGRPTDIHKTKGHVQTGEGIVLTVEYETWKYDLGPVTFSRTLVFTDGALSSIATGDYGG